MADDREEARLEGSGTDAAARDDAARAADHAGIDRLAEGLVPALIAKLGSLNVGELEVREGDWKVRLRRPGGPALISYGRRSTDRASRTHLGQEQHGHVSGAPEPHRVGRAAHAGPAASASSGAAASGAPTSGGAASGASTNGSGGPALAPVGPGRAGDGHSAGDGHRADEATAPVATSPAVGVFQPGPKAVAGTRVRAGDRLGVVDMLGVPQEVVAPVDAIVVGVIVDPGTAVEYGQELIHLEPAARVEGR